MPYSLTLEPWASQEWKVKIFDLEGPEDPHVTIYRRTSLRWRVNLRTGELMDMKPPPRGLPAGLLDAVLTRFDELRSAWDRLHPDNPVAGTSDDDE